METTGHFERRAARSVRVGNVTVGGGAPVSIQSMTNTHTRDAARTLEQIRRLAAAGCQVVRVAVPAAPDAEALAEIVRASPLPVVADIHFSTGLAIRALEAGVAKVRLNPGNIDDPEGLRRVIALAARLGRPLRFGVNSGSVRGAKRPAGGAASDSKDLVRLMVDVLMDWVRAAEKEGFRDLVLSAKASDVYTTVEAYRLLARSCDLPLHLGITAAGPMDEARTRSAIVLGALLAEGIGDTVRVSLTGDPVSEVVIAQDILAELGLRPWRGVRILSCPTCGRCGVDLIALVEELQRRTRSVTAPLTVAVMGCVVNGPGEAREADVGVAAGKGHGVLFRRGEAVRKVPEAELLDALLEEIRALAAERA
ncbi:MAG: flavodoxin-dependent (E)-4-hydroxy-3-methylbut-2-enyl-diphosphate synthase [Planctomycetes bacterium]|nr:flavodoxin-dependent (E)-4-hydroxy-3-methylbut-2-enyl-diphosphate synthase [Planctomycetota bacterium]